MKWKDSGEMTDKEEKTKEEYFDEEQYSPWSPRNSTVTGGRLQKIPLVLILLILAIITSVAALLTILFGTRGETISPQQLAMLRDNMRQIEERLDKYEAIDEKVTRIWEQAQAFERFKERYDRGEASMTLRMDHLTTGLENVQKQLGELGKTMPPAAAKPAAPADAQAVGAIKYHTVVAGDTLYSIGQRYNVELDRLRAMNRLESDVLQRGQRLIVSTGAAD